MYLPPLYKPMNSLIKNSTHPPELTRDLMPLVDRCSSDSSPALSWWSSIRGRSRQNGAPLNAGASLFDRLISKIFRNFSTFTLPQTHMGADPITNSVQLRQGSRFSNHGGN
jgi:hypothetical protein